MAVRRSDYAHLFPRDMTPAQAAERLRPDRFPLLSFGELLASLYPGGDLAPRLAAGLMAADPGRSPDAVRRSVNNWLAGRNRPQNREELFRAAFALGLTAAQTDRLLASATGCRLYCRDGREAVYAWCLEQGWDYLRARDLLGSLPLQPNLLAPPDTFRPDPHRALRRDLKALRTPEELRAFYLDNLPRLGALHTRAFLYFDRCLDQLLHPGGDLAMDEPDYSMDAVMSTYLTLHMPVGRRRAGLDPVRRRIKHGWPNTTALKNVRLRRLDVPRKLLLLMYVVTENILDEGGPVPEARQPAGSGADALNAILAACALAPLDPRDPTDYLILYAIQPAPQPMSERLEQAIQALFPGP